MIVTKQEGSKIKFYWDGRSYLGYAYVEVDGFYVFIFETVGGCWSEYALQAIVDKLTELNKEWTENISNYFKKQENKK